MARYLHMIIVLAVIALASGLALGGLNKLTYEKAQDNILKFKKIPAVADIYEGLVGALDDQSRRKVEEELLAEKKYLDLGDEGEPRLFFVIKKDGEPYAVALEDFGSGFAGDLGVMAGFILETGDLVGIGVTSMSETPGVGTRVTEESFTLQFRGMTRDSNFKVKKDGGDIDAISGATISSRAVAAAISRAKEFYEKNLVRIVQAIEE